MRSRWYLVSPCSLPIDLQSRSVQLMACSVILRYMAESAGRGTQDYPFSTGINPASKRGEYIRRLPFNIRNNISNNVHHSVLLDNLS